MIPLTNLGGAVHEAADVADVLLLELVDLLVLLVELLQLEGARAPRARVVEVVHDESIPFSARCVRLFFESRSRSRPDVRTRTNGGTSSHCKGKRRTEKSISPQKERRPPLRRRRPLPAQPLLQVRGVRAASRGWHVSKAYNFNFVAKTNLMLR